ncbi:HlyD family type I secretion periplasmic adaptor subunit [Neptunomonas japonica]|uniref:HlyD family type I secretion periplasmic adaptor subunit n=1 Tax=Neptunomonas japonica TaxID=417574 RepID=UPI00041B4F55|nr:HlyD family type I secretion periplasmic adaptor subunit [Neptunomonas japonica]
MSQKLSTDDLLYMPSVSEAMLEQTPKGARLLLWSMLAFVCIAIAWASWATLDEISRGEGEIIPSKQLQVVQNLEGGIVSEILVSEGDLVERGQILLRIDDTRFASSFKENKVRELELLAKAARLKAEAASQAFSIPEGFPPEYNSLITQEQTLYVARNNELKATLDILGQQVDQKRQELRQAESKKTQLSRSYGLLNREVKITQPLVAEGVISEVEFLRLRRQVNDLRGELDGIRLSIPRITSSLNETKKKLDEAELQFISVARAELNEVLSEAARLKESLGGMQDKITRTEVRAPVKGTVKQLLINTVEGVIQPGDELINIIPWEDTLLVEAKLKPSDIAKVNAGQRAVIKVSAYDFSIYGGVDAEVSFVSPSTILDEDGEPHYIVRLKTDKPYIGKNEALLPLISGMTVSVDIMTGKKTVMDYLLKPILKGKSRALTER